MRHHLNRPRRLIWPNGVLKTWRRLQHQLLLVPISFGVAASALEAIHNKTLQQLFHMTSKDAIDRGLTLHVFDGPGRGLPGGNTLIGFLSTKEAF